VSSPIEQPQLCFPGLSKSTAVEPANCLISGSGREFRIQAFEQGQVSCFVSSIYHSNRRLTKPQYIGEFLDGMRHGMGRFEYTSGNLFTGAWEKDMKSGFGTLKWANGDEYTGEWKENRMYVFRP
jgi:hypothetical protein